eukprot:COSAG06_NODE_3506_length_5257_cov_9.869523_2_plen_171_part_00
MGLESSEVSLRLDQASDRLPAQMIGAVTPQRARVTATQALLAAHFLSSRRTWTESASRRSIGPPFEALALKPSSTATGSRESHLGRGRSAAAAVAAGDGSTWLAGAGSAGSPQLWSHRSCWDRVGREGLWNRLDGLWNRNSLLYYVAAVKRVLSLLATAVLVADEQRRDR